VRVEEQSAMGPDGRRDMTVSMKRRLGLGMVTGVTLLSLLSIPVLTYRVVAYGQASQPVAKAAASMPLAMLPDKVVASKASAAVVVVAASQPASQPATVVAVSPWRDWLKANWGWLLFAVIIPSLINGMKAKSVREGVIGFFESVLDRASVTTNKDSPGTFKSPGVRSKTPKV
jgi:hypothetical protein